MQGEEDVEVVLEDDLKGILADDGSLFIQCRETASRKGNYWTGHWVCQAVTKDGQRGVLMTYRLKRRIFHTLHGITSFVIDLGFPTVIVPHRKGETVQLWLNGRLRIKDHGDTANERSIS